MPSRYDATGHSAGEESSSTYEGRHLTILEALMVHPAHDDDLVDHGDPVVVGENIVGVAFVSAAAATDQIAIDTEGIWFLTVVGEDDAGISAVAVGDEIYINRNTAVLSKVSNFATQQIFGYALTPMAQTAGLVAVKVHWSPSEDNDFFRYKTLTSGQYSWGVLTTLAGGASEGLNGYVEGHITGVTTGHTYGFGSWINVDDANLLAANHIITPFEGGVWAGTAQAAARVVFAGQHQAILNGAPASLHAWRLNSTQTITALIAAANPGTAGFVGGAATTSVKIGDVPLLDVVGPGICWVRVYDAAG